MDSAAGDGGTLQEAMWETCELQVDFTENWVTGGE